MAPSLHRHYPVSSVLRASPPPQGARTIPHGRPVDHPTVTPRGFPCCVRFPCVHAVATTPTQRLGSLVFTHPVVSTFPDMAVGSACATSFSRSAQRSLTLRPAHSRCHLYATRFTGGFNRFVTSTAAPVASGWNNSRVGFPPTGKTPPYHGTRQQRKSPA